MSVTEESLALTEAFRQAQVRVRGQIISDVAGLIAMLNIEDIKGSWPALEAELVALTRARRTDSVRLSQMFHTLIRNAEDVGGAFSPVAGAALNVDDLIRNLRIVGPGSAGEAVFQGRTNVRTTTASRIEGEITRSALNGGRFSSIGSARADKKCIGWIRVTDGNPCAFCRMLASRGPVYTSQDAAVATRRKFSKPRGNADGRSRGKPGGAAPAIWSDRAQGFRAHQHCACQARPIFSMDDRLVKQADKFYREYNAAYDRYPDDDPINAYRKYLRDRERAADLVRV
jgi:hypothetical protein